MTTKPTLREMNEANNVEALTAVKAAVDALLTECDARLDGMTAANKTKADDIISLIRSQILMIAPQIDFALGLPFDGLGMPAPTMPV